MPAIASPLYVPDINDIATFNDKANYYFATYFPNYITELNAAFASIAIVSTSDTSTTSNTISTGSKTFTVSSGKSFFAGMYLNIVDTAAPTTNGMFCQVVSYSGTSLVVTSIAIKGSGTKTAWSISLSAYGGAGYGVNNDITSLTAIQQIQFPSVQVPSTNVNTLDDYEEGTFTPTLSGFGGTGLSATGVYTKIGRVVYVSIAIQGTSVTATINSSQITNMPFSATSSGYLMSVGGGTTAAGYFYIATGSPQALVAGQSYASSAGVSISGFYFAS